MKRRLFSTAMLSVTTLMGTASAWAQQAFRSGKDYITLERPLATEAGKGKIEVLEFFWYSCPHCNQFEPAFEQWAKTHPRTWWCAVCLWLSVTTSCPSNACTTPSKP